MTSELLPAIANAAEIRRTYEELYDALGNAYWEAVDLHSKDLVFGARQEISRIVSELNTQDLETLTARFKALEPKIAATNRALQQIQAEINQITKNIGTAVAVIGAVNKVMTLLPRPA